MATTTTEVLRNGSTGEQVRILQRALAVAGFDPGGFDGSFGPRTRRAVSAFQASTGLLVDGIAGPQTLGALRAMPIPSLEIQQPQPFDIVGNPVMVSGMVGVFEAELDVRARDADGNVFAQMHVMAGVGDGISQVHMTLPVGRPPTALGSIELFDASEAPEEVPDITVSVPVVFGPAIMDGYSAFQPHVVASGETLSAIAQRVYGDPSLWVRIVAANPHQLSDPNLIVPGQILRIPV